MQFTYDEFCGGNILEIKDEVYNYLIKARRHKIDDEIYFRNLKDNNLYLYRLNDIDRKKAILDLISSEEKTLLNEKSLHLGWSVVDPKTVEKYIASLNEMGVDKITFIYSDYSQ
ncbi:MAG: RsmE family RNA methyltransferase, partial [Fusobacteriaceae bacterium]|nr:RsmE family RNA methyltransferase [Fusobacteriaceae bacterium]